MKKKKENQKQEQPPILLLRGETVDAEYRYQVIEEFRDNPLIEALPEILSPQEVAQKLTYYPGFSPQQRELEMKYRLHLLENAREFFIPLSRDIELYYSISNMIRRSYIHRNPILSAYYSGLNEKIDRLNEEMGKPPGCGSLRSRARGTTITGTGGNGKSTSVENNLLLLPQVIIHESYKDKDLILKQLVWLKIDCPQDGSVRGLCLAFFAAVDEVLGTSYLAHYHSRRTTINELLLHMARVAAIHCLGVLVIDEIQDLSQAKSGGETHLMNFFVHLENSIGVPFILIGTPKALPLFKGEFRQARRASEQGDFIWKRLQMLSDADSTNPADVWDKFIRQMWKYQYVKNAKLLPVNILDEPVTRILYNESQGIIAVALTIFLLTQKRAIMSGVEEINVDVMRSAVLDNQNLIRSMMDSIRLGQRISIHGETDFEPSDVRTEDSPEIITEMEATTGNGFSSISLELGNTLKTAAEDNDANACAPKKRRKSRKKSNSSAEENLNDAPIVSDSRTLSNDSLDSIGIELYLKSPTDLF